MQTYHSTMPFGRRLLCRICKGTRTIGFSDRTPPVLNTSAFDTNTRLANEAQIAVVPWNGQFTRPGNCMFMSAYLERDFAVHSRKRLSASLFAPQIISRRHHCRSPPYRGLVGLPRTAILWKGQGCRPSRASLPTQKTHFFENWPLRSRGSPAAFAFAL